MSHDPAPILTPLEVVECLVAPLSRLGRLIGAHPKSPYNWQRGSSWRDPGDLPPPVNRRLLYLAAVRGWPLTAEHLVRGGAWPEIEVLAESIGRAMPAHLRARHFPCRDKGKEERGSPADARARTAAAETGHAA